MRHFTTALAFAALCAAAAPQPAHAQLLKRVGRAVVEKAVGRDSASNAAAGARVPNAAAPPSNTLEITAERIDALVAAARPLVDYATQQRAHAASVKAQRDYEGCVARAVQSAPPPSGAAVARLEQIGEASQRVTEQYVAAVQGRDSIAARRLGDSLATLKERSVAIVNPSGLAQCGKRPVAVAEPTRGAADTAARDAATAGGMTGTQLGRLRERVAFYLLAPSGQSDLSADERAAVEARRAQLAPLVALMRDGAMPYATWHDLRW